MNREVLDFAIRRKRRKSLTAAALYVESAWFSELAVEFGGHNGLTAIGIVAASQSSRLRGLVQSSQSLAAFVGAGPNREAGRW